MNTTPSNTRTSKDSNCSYIYIPDTVYRATLSKEDLGLIEGLDFYDKGADGWEQVGISYSEFANLVDTYGMEKQPSWREFIDSVIGAGHTVLPTKRGKLIGGYWLKEHTTRANINVEAVHLFICDIDSTPSQPPPPSLDAMKARFHPQASGVFGCKVLGYTTHSHSLQHPRYRLIFPLARAVAPSEYAALWQGFNQALGGILDPATKDISRIHYLPSCPAEHLSIADWFSGNEASYSPMVNPEPLIIAGFMLIASPKPPKHLSCALPETPRTKAELQKKLSYISADCSYETYRSVVWGILSTGWTCSEMLAKDWCKGSPDRFDESNFNSVVNSYNSSRTNPITLGTLTFLARNGGWNG